MAGSIVATRAPVEANKIVHSVINTYLFIILITKSSAGLIFHHNYHLLNDCHDPHIYDASHHHDDHL